MKQVKVIENEKLNFLLSICFLNKTKEISQILTEELITKKEESLIKLTHKLSEFIDRKRAERLIKEKCFNDTFKIENFKHPVILDFLIKKLSEFEKFEWGHKEPENRHSCNDFWNLKHDGKDIGSYGWIKILGHESYKNYPYIYSGVALYHDDYYKSKEKLNSLGIQATGAGSVYDYTCRGIDNLKPHISELVEYLNNVKEIN